MRPINATNFEQSNVEFIEFWLLDTFSEIINQEDELGELYFHLGNISEDILKDGRKQFENGLPGLNGQNLVHITPGVRYHQPSRYYMHSILLMMTEQSKMLDLMV